jgi:hypothetical protein
MMSPSKEALRSRPMMVIRYGQVVSAAALILAATLFGASLDAADEATPTESAELIETTLQNSLGQGVRLAIPRAYLDRHSWDSTFVALKGVQFPDMLPPPPRRTLRQVTQSLGQKGEPATIENILNEWEADGPKHEDQGPLHYSGWIWITDGLPTGRAAMIDRFILRYPEYDDATEPGFRHYRHANNDGIVVQEYLIPREEFDARSVWLDCSPRDRYGPRTRCSLWISFGDRLGLQYTIPRSDIALWREVDVKVKALVRQFIVDCFDGPKLEPGEQPSSSYPCQF